MIKIVTPKLELAENMSEAVKESYLDLAPWMPWALPEYSIESARNWITHMAPKGHEFFILDQNSNYLGNVGINSICTVNMRANLGYWVRSSAKGEGVASTSVVELVSWVRENTNLNRLEIVAAIDNIPSRRVAEKSGAEYEGIAKSRLFYAGSFMMRLCTLLLSRLYVS